jgi:hypothetical protein
MTITIALAEGRACDNGITARRYDAAAIENLRSGLEHSKSEIIRPREAPRRR